MDLQKQHKVLDQCLSRQRKQLYKRLLTNASKGLTFSEDVMWEMGPNNIPYSKADFSWLLCGSGSWALSTRSKSRKQGGTKALPHHSRLRGSRTHSLSALPPLQTVHHHLVTTNETCIMVSGHQDGTLDSVKGMRLRGVLNEYSPYRIRTISEEKEQSRTSKVDESKLKKLTKNTDQWIVSQQIPRDYKYKASMQSQLKDKCDSASVTNLVTDESKGKEDFCGFYSVPKSSTEPKAQQSSKPETPLPVYYRIQGYSESPVCIDEQGGINRTANDVVINETETLKLPYLQDSLNPHAGKYVYHTENNFELELYTGIAKQVHQPGRKNQDHIIMDNNSKYQKHLQDMFPCGPEQWTDLPSTGLISMTKETGRLEKGVRRWVGLPTKADYATELGLRIPDYSRQDRKVSKQPIHYSPMPGLSSLRYAVEGWRNACKINTRWQSATIEGLKKDLTDLHFQVRVAAIATCASGAVNRPEVGPDPDSDPTALGQYSQSYEIEAVPPELQPLIHVALDDPVKRVQLAAAMCQYAIGTPNAHARDILLKELQRDSSGTGVDAWVAAQCLAIEGEASQPVIERLLSQLFLSNSQSDRKQATTLLVSISSKTILVRSLLGEELNSADWRNRVLACKTISELKCPVNKDLTNKLLYLMWNDWSVLVRQAAAQALGKLGLGTDIHNELSVKLHKGPTPWRVEALVLIGQLKIMTPKLLPSFLHSLNDEFVAVRKQACSAAASLMIKDEMIQNQLFQLMQNDSSCDVKVAAINGELDSALGKIGWLTPTLQELLLWALQHGEEPSVRIAACETLKMLEVKGPELQNLLQERLVLEDNAQVHRHIENLMKDYGYSLDRDKSRVQMITEQVEKLCTKNNIIEKVLQLEDLKQQKQKKMPRKECWPEPEVMSGLLWDKFRT